MAKKRAKKRKEARKPERFGISMILITLFFIIGFLQMMYLIVQRATILVNYGIAGNVGILISSILFFIYASLLVASIFLILARKKIAIKMSIIAMCQMIAVALWFNVIGVLIFYQESLRTFVSNIPYFLINLAIAIAIIAYFARSKRVRKLLVKK